MWTIYTREACNYCDMAKAEMDRLGIKYKVVEQNEKTTVELYKKLGKIIFTYPQIFDHNEIRIGGFGDLLDHTEYESSSLKQM